MVKLACAGVLFTGLFVVVGCDPGPRSYANPVNTVEDEDAGPTGEKQYAPPPMEPMPRSSGTDGESTSSVSTPASDPGLTPSDIDRDPTGDDLSTSETSGSGQTQTSGGGGSTMSETLTSDTITITEPTTGGPATGEAPTSVDADADCQLGAARLPCVLH